MMPYHMVNKDFLRAVLKGEKKLIKMRNVNFINAPTFDEVGVKNIYDRAIKRPNMLQYFPDKYSKGSQCDKTYFYNIWNTLHPQDVQAVIEHANSLRYAVSTEKNAQEGILLTDEMQQELESMPYISK